MIIIVLLLICITFCNVHGYIFNRIPSLSSSSVSSVSLVSSSPSPPSPSSTLSSLSSTLSSSLVNRKGITNYHYGFLLTSLTSLSSLSLLLLSLLLGIKLYATSKEPKGPIKKNRKDKLSVSNRKVKRQNNHRYYCYLSFIIYRLILVL